MPRRRPRDLRPPLPDERRRSCSKISGLSGSAHGVIALLERTRFAPGDTAEALWWWGRPGAESPGCGAPACCPGPPDAQPVLAAVLRLLPPRDARRLRRRMGALAGR